MLAPVLDAAPEQVGEGVDLVRRVEVGDLLADRVPGEVGAEEVVRHLVQVAKVLAAEVPEALGLEALVRDPGVARELLAVGPVLAARSYQGCQSSVWRIRRPVPALNRDQRRLALISQGKW